MLRAEAVDGSQNMVSYSRIGRNKEQKRSLNGARKLKSADTRFMKLSSLRALQKII